ncbi:MAG: hypothetical protein WKF76_00535 [Nocardioidaceae bacterium]
MATPHALGVGLGDEPVGEDAQPRWGSGLGCCCQPSVEVVDGGQVQVAGGLADHLGVGVGEAAAAEVVVGLRQPVAQVETDRDQVAGGVLAAADRQRELGEHRLGQLRRAVAADLQHRDAAAGKARAEHQRVGALPDSERGGRLAAQPVQRRRTGR